MNDMDMAYGGRPNFAPSRTTAVPPIDEPPPQEAKSTLAFCFEMRGPVALTTRMREHNTCTLSPLRYINYLVPDLS